MKTVIKIRMTKNSSLVFFLFLFFIILISIFFFVDYMLPKLNYKKLHSQIDNNLTEYNYSLLVDNLTKYNYSLFGEPNYTKIKFKKTYIISNGDYEYAKYIKSKMNENFDNIEIIENNNTIVQNISYEFESLYPVIEIKNKESNNENKEIEIFFFKNHNFYIPYYKEVIFYSDLQITIINFLKNISNIDFPPTIKVETMIYTLTNISNVSNVDFLPTIPIIYKKQELYEYSDLNIFLIIYFLVFHLHSIYLFIRMVKEKENNLNDLLYRQGITKIQNFLSWFIIYIIHFSIPFLLITFFFSSLFTMKIFCFFIILFVHILFLLNNFSFLLFLNILFTKHQIIFSILKIMFLVSIMFFILYFFSNSDGDSKLLATFILVFPTNFYMYAMNFIFKCYNNNSFDWKHLSFNINGEYNFFDFIIFAIISTIIFCLLSIIIYFIQNYKCLKKKNENIENTFPFQINDSIEDSLFNQEFNEKELNFKNENNYLNIKNITKEYGDFKAIDNLSFDLFPGEIFCLLGHNGAGKTTLIKIISGIEEPNEGDILLNGISILSDKKYFIQNIGVCHQENILFNELTVDDHIYYTLKLKRKIKNKDEIDFYIKDIGLEEKRKILCKNLSTGQKRKLCIILSLIGNNKIILLDEPTSGLDAVGRRELWKFLQRNKGDKIIILTTHSLEEAEFLGDRIGIIKEGKLVCSGTSSFLKNKFPHGYNINLLINSRFNYEDRQQIFNDLKEIDSTSFIKVSSDSLFKINFNDSNENIINAVFKYIEDSKYTCNINKYTVSTTSLEDVFINLNLKEFSNQLLKIPQCIQVVENNEDKIM